MEIALLFIPPNLFILMADLCSVMSSIPPPHPHPSGLRAKCWKRKETQSLRSDWLRKGCVILGFYDLFVRRNLMPCKVFSGTNIEALLNYIINYWSLGCNESKELQIRMHLLQWLGYISHNKTNVPHIVVFLNLISASSILRTNQPCNVQ